MAKRLGNISKSSFRFLREASLYAYAGIALLGAFYISYLAFSYEGEITALEQDFRSELIADSQISDEDGVPIVSDEITNEGKGKTSDVASSSVIPVAINPSEKKTAQAGSIEKPVEKVAEKVVAAVVPTKKPVEKTVAKTPQTKTTPTKKVETVSTPKTETPAPGKFQWVLKSFNNPEFASNWVGKFREMGLQTKVVKAKYDGKTWYRVAHGSYPSKAAARAEKAKLPSTDANDYWISSAN